MDENRSGKRPYVRPMLVFVDGRTGELRGSPEMIARMRRDRAEPPTEAQPQPSQSGPGRKGPAEDG